jgi:hypothetical protein
MLARRRRSLKSRIARSAASFAGKANAVATPRGRAGRPVAAPVAPWPKRAGWPAQTRRAARVFSERRLSQAADRVWARCCIGAIVCSANDRGCAAGRAFVCSANEAAAIGGSSIRRSTDGLSLNHRAGFRRITNSPSASKTLLSSCSVSLFCRHNQKSLNLKALIASRSALDRVFFIPTTTPSRLPVLR